MTQRSTHKQTNSSILTSGEPTNDALLRIDERQSQRVVDAIGTRLRVRFPEHSPDAKELAPIGLILDVDVLNKLLDATYSARDFSDFCKIVTRVSKEYFQRLEADRSEETYQAVMGQAFNNFVAQCLGQRPRLRASFLKKYIGEISPELVDILDFDATDTEPTVFVMGNNVARLCDLLFSIPYKDKTLGYFPVVALLEHKSAPDRRTVLQMTECLCATLHFVSRNPKKFTMPDGRWTWPFLILFYTGARPWRRVLNLADLFGTPSSELDRRWIFRVKFLMIRLASRFRRQTKKDGLQNEPWLQAFLELTNSAEKIVANKNATEEEWIEAWNQAFAKLKNHYEPTDLDEKQLLDDYLTFVGLICRKKGFNVPTREDTMQVFKKIGDDKMFYYGTTIWEQEREEGRKEGMREGMKEGKNEGKEEEKRLTILRILRNRKFTLPETLVNRIVKIQDEDVYDQVFDVIFDSTSSKDCKSTIERIISDARKLELANA